VWGLLSMRGGNYAAYFAGYPGPEASRPSQTTVSGWMPEESRMNKVCPKCGSGWPPDWQECPACSYMSEDPVPDGFGQRLIDGFALLNASEDIDIDPNQHI